MLSFRSVGGAVLDCILQCLSVAPESWRATLVRSCDVSSDVEVGQIVKTAFH